MSLVQAIAIALLDIDPPLVLAILARAVFALVLGILGSLVAVLLLGAITVPIKRLYVEDVVRDDVAVAGAEAG